MEYVPIARAMAQANLSEAARLKNKRKMDIVYTITKKNLTEMGVICELDITDGISYNYDCIIHCNYQCNNTFNNYNINFIVILHVRYKYNNTN